MKRLDDHQRNLAAEHVHLAYACAVRAHRSRPWADFDELYSAAMAMLVYLAGRFDARREVPFGAYACLYIGAKLRSVDRQRRPVPFARLGGRVTERILDELIARQEPESHIEELLGLLPPSERILLRQRFVDGIDYVQTGKRHGVSRQAIEQRARTALERLRNNPRLSAWRES